MGIRERLLASTRKMDFTCPISGEELRYTDLSARQIKEITVKSYEKYPGDTPKDKDDRIDYMVKLMLVEGLSDQTGERVARDLAQLEELGSTHLKAYGARVLYFVGNLSDDEVHAIEESVKKKE